MKKSLFICLLIFALSSPAFAGHQQAGGYGYCECTPVNGVCPCCERTFDAARIQGDEPICQFFSDDTEPMLEPGFIRLALLMWLKLGA